MKCDEYVEKLVEKYEKNHTKEILGKTQKLFKDVMTFLRKEKVIMYGGWAINAHLPAKKRFYEENSMNDFDGFVVSAKDVAHRLTEKLKGNKYLDIREARHPNTYKISIQSINICDITDVSQREYDLYLKGSVIDNEFGLILCSTDTLKRMMMNELSQPKQSIYRWSKVRERYMIFLSQFPTTNKRMDKIIPNNQVSSCITYILKYAKDNRLPLVGSVALQIHEGKPIKPYVYSRSQPFVTILSKDELDWYGILVKHGVEKDRISISSSMLWETKRVDVYIDRVFVLEVIDCSDMCLSVLKQGGVYVGSIATIGYILYDEICFYKDETDDLKKVVALCDKVTRKCDKMMSVSCYGTGKYMEDIVKEYWNKKFYRYKKPIKKSDKSLL